MQWSPTSDPYPILFLEPCQKQAHCIGAGGADLEGFGEERGIISHYPSIRLTLHNGSFIVSLYTLYLAQRDRWKACKSRDGIWHVPLLLNPSLLQPPHPDSFPHPVHICSLPQPFASAALLPSPVGLAGSISSGGALLRPTTAPGKWLQTQCRVLHQQPFYSSKILFHNNKCHVAAQPAKVYIGLQL